nr:hypothetical protein [Planktothrix rubescens]
MPRTVLRSRNFVPKSPGY